MGKDIMMAETARLYDAETVLNGQTGGNRVRGSQGSHRFYLYIYMGLPIPYLNIFGKISGQGHISSVLILLDNVEYLDRLFG